MSTARWPRSWNWRSLRSTTACPSVSSLPDGSMPSFTRSGRPSLAAQQQLLGQAAGRQHLRGAGGQDLDALATMSGGSWSAALRLGSDWWFRSRGQSARPVERDSAARRAPAAGAVGADRGFAGEPEPPRPVGRDGDARPAGRCGSSPVPAGSAAGCSRSGDAGGTDVRSGVGAGQPSARASRAGPRARSRSASGPGARDRARSAPAIDRAGPQQHRRRDRRRGRRRGWRTSACRR